jgi:plasmid stabilization system protein ParE
MPKRLHSIKWSGPALKDLLETVEYIKIDNKKAAYDLAKDIKGKVSRLSRFPNSGRIVPEFPTSGFREIIIGIISDKYTVEILALRHGARPLEDEPQLFKM